MNKHSNTIRSRSPEHRRLVANNAGRRMAINSIARSPFATSPVSNTGAAIAVAVGLAYAGLFSSTVASTPEVSETETVVAVAGADAVAPGWGLEIRGSDVAAAGEATVAKVIADQGNQAIEQIRSDARLAMSPASMQPRLDQLAVAWEPVHVASARD